MKEAEIVAAFQHGVTAYALAKSLEVTEDAIWDVLEAQGIRRPRSQSRRGVSPPSYTLAPKPRSPVRKTLPPSGGVHARFKAPKAEPERSYALSRDHAAVVEGRTLFPTRVIGPWSAERLLKSGKHNPKTGAKVVKGPWAGMSIFTLTLEERKTCPTACAMYRACYGNAMHIPHRHDGHHEDFIAVLVAETITLAREHPDGLVIRLHILGDFFSVPYVKAWAFLMEMLPNLHVFGYTARRLDDPASADIAAEIKKLNDAYPDRWVIRTSHTESGPMRSIVVEQKTFGPGVFTCPAQTEATAACSTCGLCWAPTAKEKTVAFIRHGMKR